MVGVIQTSGRIPCCRLVNYRVISSVRNEFLIGISCFVILQPVHENIAHILNTTAKDGNPPDELKIGILTPLPKPGKKKGPPENLRPIILLSVLRKLLTICLMRRTWDRLKTRIPLDQAAYQEGRSTTEQVFSMKLLAEKAITSSDYKIYILLLDMSKAFDTVNRNQLFETLEEILLPDELHLLHDFVEWCDQSYLCLNETKTKDMCIDFRRDPPPQTDTVIHDNAVEMVDEYKYLGTTIDNKLRWDRHCTVTYKKCQQRLYCLRKLRSFNVDNTILSMFYKSCIQSVLTFSFICWFGNVSQKDKNSLQRIVNISSKVTGVTQSTLTALYEKQVVNKATRILADDKHVLYADYILLPSSRRFRTVTCKTNRKRFSFVPMSIRLLNDKSLGHYF